MIVEVVAATDRVKVSLSAPKSMVLFEMVFFQDHAVCTSTTVDLSAVANSAGEQEEIRSSVGSDDCSIIDTSREVQGVLISTTMMLPPERSPPKETESLPAPPSIVEAVCSFEAVTTKVSLPEPPAIEDAL